MTSPLATVVLDCEVTVPRATPAAVKALVAAACVSFTTFGTVSCVPVPPPGDAATSLPPPPQPASNRDTQIRPANRFRNSASPECQAMRGNFTVRTTPREGTLQL